jgi:hypothetical protein
VSGYLIGSQAAGKNPLPPNAELQWWYQYYFATERGRAGYERYRKDFAKLIWKIASPKWNFDDATFDRSAASFDNPDHVAIVIHNYRWRLSLADGERKYDDFETRLAQFPAIGVPTITLEGDANGAPHPEPASYAKKFSGKYEHRLIEGGVGHNLPQETPQAFVQAVIDVNHFEGESHETIRASCSHDRVGRLGRFHQTSDRAGSRCVRRCQQLVESHSHSPEGRLLRHRRSDPAYVTAGRRRNNQTGD